MNSYGISPRIVLITIGFSLFAACANPRKLAELEEENTKLTQKHQACAEELEKTRAANKRLNKRVALLEEDISDLQRDTTVYGRRYRKVSALNKDVNEMYEKLKNQYKEMLSNTSSEKEQVSMELEMKKRELEQKERELEALADDLNTKKEDVDRLHDNLKERQARIRKLEKTLNQKDSAVVALREKVAKALLGFEENDELSIEMKNGKVYVSLTEKLLFKSGSIEVDPKGVDALSKLAKVLEKNTDINVLIEGHTDNVPLSGGSCRQDNWDLSVMRATSIVRILTEKNNVDARRVTAAGRSKFHPVASNDTGTGRQKNRRTEIILTPDLDELFRILESD